MAPRVALANMATTASSILGTKPATRSPGRTPCLRREAAKRCHSFLELAVGHPAYGAGFSHGDERDRIIVKTKQVLGKVELQFREEPTAEHRVADTYWFYAAVV